MFVQTATTPMPTRSSVARSHLEGYADSRLYGAGSGVGGASQVRSGHPQAATAVDTTAGQGRWRAPPSGVVDVSRPSDPGRDRVLARRSDGRPTSTDMLVGAAPDHTAGAAVALLAVTKHHRAGLQRPTALGTGWYGFGRHPCNVPLGSGGQSPQLGKLRPSRLARASAWVNDGDTELSELAPFTVIPRCSPPDLVRLWCGVMRWSAARVGERIYDFRHLSVSSQDRQAGTRFVMSSAPPCSRGSTWSTISARTPMLAQ